MSGDGLGGRIWKILVRTDAAFAVRMALSVLLRVVTAWGEAPPGGEGGEG